MIWFSNNGIRVTGYALVLAALAGCARFPQLDEVISAQARAADYPALVASDSVGFAEDASDDDAGTAALAARVARLRARARAMRAPVVDKQTRVRMHNALARHYR